MLLLMTHPKHGLHYVYSEHEATEHEKRGWVRPLKTIKEPEIAPKMVIEKPLTIKRRGRPPKVTHIDNHLQ